MGLSYQYITSCRMDYDTVYRQKHESALKYQAPYKSRFIPKAKHCSGLTRQTIPVGVN